MSSVVHQPPLKMIAKTAAADSNGAAAELAGRSAAIVPFRWQWASLPPVQIASSAVSPDLPAVHSVGNMQLLPQLQ